MVEEQAQVPQGPDEGAEDSAEEAWRDAVEEHCDQFLGPCPNVIAETSSDLVRIDLDPYLPAHNRDRTTVLTVGVSTRVTNAPDAMASYRHIELFTYLPANWTYGTDEAHWWPCRMLKDVGRLVHRYDTWYAPGQLLGGDADEPLTNWYRNLDRNWGLTEHLAGAKVMVPSLFVGGRSDPVLIMNQPETMDPWVTDHRGTVLIDGAGHWVQQEKPDEVNAALVPFIAALRDAPARHRS